MFEFRLADHRDKPGVKLVEIIQNGEVVGAVYPTETGLKIVSRYLLADPETAVEIDRSKLPPIPAILIHLLRKGRH